MVIKKQHLLYGFMMGISLLLLQIFNYKAILRDVSIETYGFIIAVIFVSIGVWIGRRPGRKSQSYHTESSSVLIESNLSEREMEVLKAMASGLSNQEIADKLFVSLNTIKTHSSNIFSKLNVKRRTQAIQKARESNLI